MIEEKGYTLYVGNNCCSCNNIHQFLKENNINISTINIDEQEYHLPFSLLVIPALIKNKELIAYGPDILKYFQKQRA
jgi:glutaredoxin